MVFGTGLLSVYLTPFSFYLVMTDIAQFSLLCDVKHDSIHVWEDKNSNSLLFSITDSSDFQTLNFGGILKGLPGNGTSF